MYINKLKNRLPSLPSSAKHRMDTGFYEGNLPQNDCPHDCPHCPHFAMKTGARKKSQINAKDSLTL
jgi:hypothetical protein